MDYPLHSLVLLFFVYAFLGWCCEVCYAALRSGGFVNRGFLNGPICPIYGVGMVIVILCLTPVGDSLIGLFLGSFVLTTALEYGTGQVLEKLFHLKWWDYSGRKCNVRGYICLEFSILWGIAGTVIMKVVHPLLYGLVSLLPTWLAWTLDIVFLILLAADLGATLAQIRQLQKRLERIEALASGIHSVSDAMAKDLYDGVQAALVRTKKYQEELETLQAELEEKKAEAEAWKTAREEAAEEHRLLTQQQRAELEAQLQMLQEKLKQSQLDLKEKRAVYEASRQRLSAVLAGRKLQAAETGEERRCQAQALKAELEAQLKATLESPRRRDRRLLRAFPGMRVTRRPSDALERLRAALRPNGDTSAADPDSSGDRQDGP